MLFGLASRGPSPRALQAADISFSSANATRASTPLESQSAGVRQPLGRAVPKPEPQSGPLQLSGRVVDDSGHPLAGAHVLIAEYDADKPGLVSTVSADDGSFEARGEWSTTELVVRATHDDCWNSGYRRVLRGSASVDLQLERYSTLGGVLEMRNGRTLPDLVLELTNRDTNKKSSANLDFESSHGSIVRIPSDPFTCTKDGAFTISGLRPGLYELTVRGDGLREVLAHLAEIRVGAGEPPSPASCNPLLLELPAREPVTIELEVADFPQLGSASSVRVTFEADFVRKKSESFSALLDEHGHGTLMIPKAGRYQVIWTLEMLDSERSMTTTRPLTPAEPRFVDVAPPSAYVRLELDALQLAALSRRTGR